MNIKFSAKDIYSAITDREYLEAQVEGSYLKDFLENPPNLILTYDNPDFDIEVAPADQEAGENGHFINMDMRAADIIGKQNDPDVIEEMEKAAKAVMDKIADIEEYNNPD